MSTDDTPMNDARMDNAIARISDGGSIAKGALEQTKLAYHALMLKDAQRELLARHDGDALKAAQEIDPTLSKLEEIESAAATLGKIAREVKKLAARARDGITDHYEETLVEADRQREQIKENRKAGGGPLFGTEEPPAELEAPPAGKTRGRKRSKAKETPAPAQE